MSFERIGPFRLRVRDHVAASLVISFVTGSRARQVMSAVALLFGLGVICWALMSGDLVPAGLLTLFLAYHLLLKPAVRAHHGSGDHYLSYDPEGLMVDTTDMRTLCKWPTIGSFRKIGPRLYIMMGSISALVIPDRVTSHDNMAALMASLTDHRSKT